MSHHTLRSAISPIIGKVILDKSGSGVFSHDLKAGLVHATFQGRPGPFLFVHCMTTAVLSKFCVRGG